MSATSAGRVRSKVVVLNQTDGGTVCESKNMLTMVARSQMFHLFSSNLAKSCWLRSWLLHRSSAPYIQNSFLIRCNHGMSGDRCQHTHEVSPGLNKHKQIYHALPGSSTYRLEVDVNGSGVLTAQLEDESYCFVLPANCIHGRPVHFTQPSCEAQ